MGTTTDTGAPAFPGKATSANWLVQLNGGRVFRTVAAALGARSIPVLPVKGIVTAHLLYEDAATRPIHDVDVRLCRRDFPLALRVAKDSGWRIQRVVLLGQALWRVAGMDVDVKCALGPPGLCAMPVDDVMDRAESRFDPLGVLHLEPEINDHALMLVLNVFKDGLLATPWAVEDLRRIARHPRFDAGTLIARASAGRVATALWLVARWLCDAHDALDWRPVHEGIGPRPPSARAAATYALWRRAGAPRRVGHFVVPTVGDDAWRAAAGLGLATAGLASGYGLRAAGAVSALRRSRPATGGPSGKRASKPDGGI